MINDVKEKSWMQISLFQCHRCHAPLKSQTDANCLNEFCEEFRNIGSDFMPDDDEMGMLTKAAITQQHTAISNWVQETYKEGKDQKDYREVALDNAYWTQSITCDTFR